MVGGRDGAMSEGQLDEMRLALARRLAAGEVGEDFYQVAMATLEKSFSMKKGRS